MPIDCKLIKWYLEKICQFLDQGNYTMRARDKRELYLLGISYQEVRGIIKSLKCEHYVSGPEPDDQVPEQDIFVFGYLLENTELYIKLTVKLEKQLFIMSFHEASYPLKYPFKI